MVAVSGNQAGAEGERQPSREYMVKITRAIMHLVILKSVVFIPRSGVLN
jgi:hypothetical protein